jgi:hypothetical protein
VLVEAAFESLCSVSTHAKTNVPARRFVTSRNARPTLDMNALEPTPNARSTSPMPAQSRGRLTAAVAVVAGVLGAFVPAAHADPLTTARYQLNAADGHVIQSANCLTDQQAAGTSLCQSLIGRNGQQVLWERDARAAGAATATFTEAGDGFTGTSTYTVPADDNSPYQLTTTGFYPPSRKITTHRYRITSVTALANETKCLVDPQVAVCVISAMQSIDDRAGAARHKSRSHKRRASRLSA